MVGGIASGKDEGYAAPTTGSFGVDVAAPDDPGGAWTVRIVREAWREGDVSLGRVFWATDAKDGVEAAALRDWLLADAARLAVWARTASVHGSPALDAVLLPSWLEERRERRRRRALERERAREGRLVGLSRAERLGGEYQVIVMARGCDRAPFAVLWFDRASDRDRVWDFMVRVEERWSGWRRLMLCEGRDALEREIFSDMLRTEARVKRAGLGAGGGRPLRFWRGDPA
jgi:hypothetical protein